MAQQCREGGGVTCGPGPSSEVERIENWTRHARNAVGASGTPCDQEREGVSDVLTAIPNVMLA